MRRYGILAAIALLALLIPATTYAQDAGRSTIAVDWPFAHEDGGEGLGVTLTAPYWLDGVVDLVGHVGQRSDGMGQNFLTYNVGGRLNAPRLWKLQTFANFVYERTSMGTALHHGLRFAPGVSWWVHENWALQARTQAFGVFGGSSSDVLSEIVDSDIVVSIVGAW